MGAVEARLGASWRGAARRGASPFLLCCRRLLLSAAWRVPLGRASRSVQGGQVVASPGQMQPSLCSEWRVPYPVTLKTLSYTL